MMGADKGSHGLIQFYGYIVFCEAFAHLYAGNTRGVLNVYFSVTSRKVLHFDNRFQKR